MHQCCQQPNGVVQSVVCASYSRNRIHCSLQLLLVCYITSSSVYKKIVTGNYIISTIYHMQFVLDEKEQPGSYIRHTTHFFFLRKSEYFKCTLWSEKYSASSHDGDKVKLISKIFKLWSKKDKFVKKCIFGHNLQTTNARRPIKDSKDMDFSLP